MMKIHHSVRSTCKTRASEDKNHHIRNYPKKGSYHKSPAIHFFRTSNIVCDIIMEKNQPRYEHRHCGIVNTSIIPRIEDDISWYIERRIFLMCEKTTNPIRHLCTDTHTEHRKKKSFPRTIERSGKENKPRGWKKEEWSHEKQNHIHRRSENM